VGAKRLSLREPGKIVEIIDMEVMKMATAKIEEHQREIVRAENSHRTAIVDTDDGADDKGKEIN
jgi:hypothetical protein